MARTNAGARPPLVSVLMPTYRQASFLPRALESLRAQTLEDWELVVVDDGSPDATPELLAAYRDEPRIRVHRLERNGGLGAALNLATGLARGKYLAYLPSDDAFFPAHLERLAARLDAEPETYLAYGGVRWHASLWRCEHGAWSAQWLPVQAPTARGSVPVGREREFFEELYRSKERDAFNVSPLALVQVMHRRELEADVRWTPREEMETQRLLPDFWRALLSRGARFAYAGAITCEWVRQAEQRQQLLVKWGISRFRGFYGIRPGERLKFVSAAPGPPSDERVAYAHVDAPAPGAASGLKILLAGELGFNPERICVLEAQGHRISGMWIPDAGPWDTVGPLPFGNVQDIPQGPGWQKAIEAAAPDVIYGLLNWHAIPLVQRLLDARLGIPLVFHLKEGPFHCQHKGLWPALMDVLARSDGLIFLNEEVFEWFQLATDGQFRREEVLVLDGEQPPLRWMTDDWSPKLSERDGELHTVCPGRPMGIDPGYGRPREVRRFERLIEAGIHVHIYGGFKMNRRLEKYASHLHVHPNVLSPSWVRELSKYDAGWTHIYEYENHGDLGRAVWSDLNLPARINTLAAAGLPWIFMDKPDSRTSVGALAKQHDIGVPFRTERELAEKLRDRRRMAELTANVRRARREFSFEAKAQPLVSYFRQVIARRRGAGSRGTA